jgi:hypothetical protein
MEKPPKSEIYSWGPLKLKNELRLLQKKNSGQNVVTRNMLVGFKLLMDLVGLMGKRFLPKGSFGFQTIKAV